jgi:Fumarylacetoacetate (FAA) hydrolase family
MPGISHTFSIIPKARLPYSTDRFAPMKTSSQCLHCICSSSSKELSSADKDNTRIKRLKLWTKLNANYEQRGNASDMLFVVCEMLAYFSSHMTLLPDDILATGPPPGFGFGKNRFMAVGDVGMRHHRSRLSAARNLEPRALARTAYRRGSCSAAVAAAQLTVARGNGGRRSDRRRGRVCSRPDLKNQS